jgi:hypothetical protein
MAVSFLNKATMPGSSTPQPLTDTSISGTTGSPTTATYTDGGINYKTYAFTGSGSITFSKAGLVDLLVIGGGGGNQHSTYGSGAGGFISQTNFYVSDSAVTVTIGAGGASQSQGGHSVFDKLFAIGGGAGSSSGTSLGYITTGASTGCSTVSGVPKVAGQGNAGFVGPSGGGGGGAGGDGGATDGGVGTASTIRAGTSVTYSTGGPKSGGAGSANTGNGSGGTAPSAGGSGIIIVRVLQ